MITNENLIRTKDGYIESGEYFKDAQSWYRFKYLHPFTQRSFIMILCTCLIIIFTSIALHIYFMFPLNVRVNYYINASDLNSKSAQIIHADKIKGDPLKSIAEILIENYVKIRESYDYDNLKNQFIFVRNNSTRIIFRKFFNFMNIDNPDSPVLKYQNNLFRNVTIKSISHPEKNRASIYFTSSSSARGGGVVEHKLWQANIRYEIDDINLWSEHGSRFNFTVTDYDLTLVSDNLSGK